MEGAKADEQEERAKADRQGAAVLRSPPPVPALTMRSGGGVLPMKHSTLPPSPLTAYCTASLEIMGGPASKKMQSGPAGTYSICAPSPPTQATHHLHKVAPPAQPLRSEARWPGRCRCRHLPGSPTSTAAGCCYSGPGQREQPRVGSQEAWAPRFVWAPALEALERKQEGPQVNSQKGNRIPSPSGPSPDSKQADI